MLPNLGVQSSSSYSERRTAVIAAKGDSNMYWLGVEYLSNRAILVSYFVLQTVKMFFQFDRVLCVDHWQKNVNYNHFNPTLKRNNIWKKLFLKALYPLLTHNRTIYKCHRLLHLYHFLYSLPSADCPVFSPQAEVWDLEILRSNNGTWPVDATDLKDGVITIKGHTDVGHFKYFSNHMVCFQYGKHLFTGWFLV